jgi:Autotransporter beta-domain
MRSIKLFSAISLIGLILPQQAFAGSNPCTSASGTYINGFAGDCTAPDGFSPGGFDSLELDIGRSSVIFKMDSDITASTNPAAFTYFWRDITFQGTLANPSRVEIESISATTFQPDGGVRYLRGLEALTLDNIYYENDINLLFSSDANAITFENNSTFFQSSASLGVTANKAFALHSKSGDNKLVGWQSSTGVSGPTSLTIDSGSSLRLEEMKRTSSTDFNIGNAFKFSGGTTADINGTLELKSSNLDFVDGVFNVNSGGELIVDNSSYVYLKDLNINNGGKTTINYGNSTIFATTVNFDGGELSIPESGKVEAATINVLSNSTISGSSGTAAIDAQVLQGQAGVALQVNDVNQFDADTLLLANGFTINANNAGLRVKGDIVFNGGDLNLTNGSDFSLFGVNKGNSGAIIASASSIYIAKGAVFERSDTVGLSLGSNASLAVYGEFYSGSNLTLSADSTAQLKIVSEGSYDGVISPGSMTASATKDIIGTLTTDSEIYFTNDLEARQFSPSGAKGLLDTGSFDGGYYLADLRLNGTTPENDQILYGNGDVDIAAMKAIKVRVHGNPTAAALDGKEFTVLAAQDGTKTGQIIRLGQALDIEEDSGIPVLIDFFAVDNQTNGKEDITLVAEEQLPITLQKHVSVTGNRNKQSVAALLPVAATATPSPSVPAQTPAQQQAQLAVHSALQTTTNAQVGASFTSIHPEPVSSNMTIQIEQADNMLNTVLAVNSVSKRKEGEQQALGSYFFGSSQADNSGLWANINYIDGEVDGQDDLGNFDYYLSSFTLGSELLSSRSYGLGTFFGFSKQVMSEHDESDMNFDTDAYHLGLYGNALLSDKASMNWAFGHGWLSTDSRRATSLGSISETATGEYESQLNYMGLRINYDTSWMKAIESKIYGGFAYLRNDQEAFQEEGAPNLGLSVDRVIVHSAIVSAGVEVKRAVDAEQNTHVLSGVRYDYDFEAAKNSEHDMTAAFNFSPTQKQSFVGQNRGPHAVTLDLGVDHEIEENWLISMAGSFTRSSHGKEVGGDLTMNWLW